jgi:hypothetical protein
MSRLPKSVLLEEGNDGASQVPGEPLCARALLSDPGGPRGRGHCSPPGVAFRLRDGVGPCKDGHFEAQPHGSRARCLRFAGAVTHSHARLATGCSASLAGRDWLPAGLHHGVSSGHLLPPRPGLAWRTTKSSSSERICPAWAALWSLHDRFGIAIGPTPCPDCATAAQADSGSQGPSEACEA